VERWVQGFAMRALIALLFLALPACASGQQSITIAGPEGLGLQAELFLPQGSARGPAILALHGCAGFRRRDGQITRLYRAWAAEFTTNGQAVLLPDSFSSRGQGEQCTVRDSQIRPGRERRQDAIAAATWLAAQPFAAPGGVVVMGWSHGGSTALATAAQPEAAPIRAYVAMYPGCFLANRSAGWRSSAPMLLLIGEADNWTRAEYCRELAGRNGEMVTFRSYPGAHHGFDAPDTPLTERMGLNTPTGRATYGTDHAARRDALAMVRAFIAAQPR
jgi:dienelactone hydrolase